MHFAHDSLDMSSRGGRLSADLQAVIAADYIRNLSEETKKGHRGRLKQGLYPFPAPIGYLNTGPGKLKGVDPVRGPLIRTAFELYATGNWSLATLADELYERGLRTAGGKRVHKPLVGAILHNPFYKGTIRIKVTGATYPGKHERLVTPRLFKEVQDRFAGKCVRHKGRHQYLFRGLFTCAHCERYLVGEKQKGRVYYRCHARGCPSKTVREDTIEAEIRHQLSHVYFTDEEMTYLEQEVTKRRERTTEDAAATRASLVRDLGNVEARLTRLTTAFVDGDIERELFLKTKERLQTEKVEIEEKQEELTANPAAYLDRVAEVLELAKDPLFSYETGEPHEKRVLVEKLSSNRVLSGNELAIQLRDPFPEIAYSSCVLEWSPSQDTARKSVGNSCPPRHSCAEESLSHCSVHGDGGPWNAEVRPRALAQLDSLLTRIILWATESS